MIKIGQPFITTENDIAYLRAHISIPDDAAMCYQEVTSELTNTAWLTTVDYPPASWKDDGTMWFSVSTEYSKYLCKERSDAFIIACLWYAMVTQSDIEFEAPVSARLYEGLTKKLIPALSNESYGNIKLIGPVSNEPIWHENGVVTGMSCGVDSLYTLLCYGEDTAPDGMKLTHLVYYDRNYLLPRVQPPYDLDEIYEKAAQPHKHYIEHAKTIAKHHSLPLIVMRNNIDRDFYRGARIFTSMHRFLACTLALAHLYGTYISSSSGHEDNVEVSLFAPTQHYENLMCESCRTETLSYVTSDHKTRAEKLRALADDKDAQEFLAVCYNPDEHGANCGNCYACWKTIIPLDIMDKLEGFEKSFDLNRYRSERKKVFKDLIDFSKRPEASSARDSVRQFVKLAEKEQSEAGREFLETLK